ncbi:MAG TPA: branched-chain amino acid ABC transporter substrate-binding protein [Mycobacteriales bacterium]|nr:branched-chain amino acid ABC transporter substrate-binding protein [Mycobacteriales bacterium]
MAATVVTASLTLAACGSSKKSTGTANGNNGGSKKTLEIGFQGPLSVNSPQLGLNAEYGINVAIAEANAKGDLPYTLKIKTSDDQGSPDQGPTAAKALIDDPNVIAVVGPMFSGATKASEPGYTQANLLSVTPSATNPALTTLGFTTFFRLIPNDNNQGKGAADYIAKVLNAKKVFSLDDKSDYGTGLSTALEAELKTDGVAVTHDGINPTKDYSAEASKIISAKPDVLYYSGYYQDFSLLAKALRGAGFKGTLFSGDGSNDDQYISGAGKTVAEGTYLSCGCGDANSDPKAADFVKAVAADNSGAKPGTYSGEAYDATNSIISVLKGLGASPTRQQVVDAYKSVDYTGLTKEVKYDSTGEIEGNAIYIYQVKDGVRTVLGTTGDLIK